MKSSEATAKIQKILEEVESDCKCSDAVQIAVLDKGFVYVAHVEVTPTFVILRKAQNIRYWGTTKGLGELTAGPTKNTKYDPVGTVRVPIHALIHLIDTVEGAWKL